MKCSEAAKLT